MIRTTCIATALIALTSATAARAEEFKPIEVMPLNLMQIVNPADKAEGPKPTTSTTPPAEKRRLGTWEMPAVTVVGETPGALREEDHIGSYDQPRWTADRRFTGTRTYVIPENKLEFEYWLKPEVPRHGATEFQALYEVEIGLPHRFQLDLYHIENWEAQGKNRSTGDSLEIRYAFADWGKIWGNPTFYIEYTFLENEPDRVETKLLFTGEFAPRWHWGVNLSFETAIAGIRDHEYEITGGISYTVIDEKFSIGAEFEGSLFDTKFNRLGVTNDLKIGPSIQWRPLPQMHVDLAPLIGVTNESNALKVYLVIGYEF